MLEEQFQVARIPRCERHRPLNGLCGEGQGAHPTQVGRQLPRAVGGQRTKAKARTCAAKALVIDANQYHHQRADAKSSMKCLQKGEGRFVQVGGIINDEEHGTFSADTFEEIHNSVLH
jgi:hypothetical protein